MTREEAIARIKDHMSVHKIYEERAVKITEALNMAISALQQSEQRWVPVTERLPEDDTVVLVCGKNGGVYTAIHNNSKTWIRGWWKMNSRNHHCNPTAWMPLPESYRGEKDV